VNQMELAPAPELAVSADAIFDAWLGRLSEALADKDADAFAQLFGEDGHWRDILSFTWERRSFQGEAIAAAFTATAAKANVYGVRIAEGRTAPRFARRGGRAVVEGWFAFETAIGAGAGFARLHHDPAKPLESRAWLALTTLQSVRGFEERVGLRRATGSHYSRIEAPTSWAQERESEKAFAHRDPEVLIVGGGQGGLILAARLRQMGVDTLVVEKSTRIGDVWRDRYNNLTLHNKLSANHFPYLPFPTTWPVWLPKDMLADWLEAYAKFLELNVWTGTAVRAASYDEAKGAWTVQLAGLDGAERTLRCRHLVMSTGVSGGVAKRPDLPGLSEFRGTVLHSSEFRSGADWAGKRALVVGTGNSGHDIAQDLYVSKAAAVTLMQRGPTCVVSLEPSASLSYAVYSEDEPVEDVDLMVAAIPHANLIDTYRWLTQRMRGLDDELLSGLRGVGFKIHDGPDDTGFQLLYLRGAGGYYIDVGCSELLIEKKIGLLQAEDIERFEAGGVRLKDGRLEPLDLIVLATGFESIQDNVRRMLGDAVADRLGPVWGFDSEGNVRNMWTRTAQPGLWLMGGAILEGRLNSRFLALEIKASLLGLLPEPADLPIPQRPQPFEPEV